jgi:hypothetical protein
MAIDYLDLTAVSVLLREDWEPRLVEAINNSVPLHERLDKEIDTAKTLAGRDLVMHVAVQVSANQAFKSIPAGGTMPEAQDDGYAQLEVPMRYLYGSIALLGQTLKATHGSNTDTVNMLNRAMKSIEHTARRRFGNMIHNDGSCALAQVNGATVATKTTVLDNPGNIWIEPGMVLGAWTLKTGGTNNDTNMTVGKVLPDGVTIVFTAVQTLADDDWLFIIGPDDAADDTSEQGTDPMGLLGLVDDGTGTPDIFGVDRTADDTEWANGQLIDAGNAALSESIIMQGMDAGSESVYSSGNPCTVMVTDFLTRRYVAKILITKQIYMNTREGKLGFTEISYAVGEKLCDLIADQRAWPGYLYFLAEDDLKFYYVKGSEWQWRPHDANSIIVYSDPNRTDGYLADYFAYVNFAAVAFPTHARVYNYAEPA